MDSFTTFTAIFSTPKVEDDNMTSSSPVDEESTSSGGNSYCVVA
ncbi:fungal mating type pheromone-like peptide [Serpula lacrymans var. lacrymans S7.9]|uniref:Fungal mating type pheromone-like peptide n=1 Tax=Serpula lacrymans var. lacrymans (strain S7.9) TaxID=578457 RepID=F8NW86_SERL9|nr:fungal mating type pheromone-like peptide [Serpula lacrymans var. lacrymans S7.9]EGO25069.1 fungal mating type pheromone-like peptide [Serpula lacrymans var. lacrymans S7.9]